MTPKDLSAHPAPHRMKGRPMMKAAVLLVLLIAGCSSIKGVTITEDERKACEVATCTVWTLEELEGLARAMFRRGYEAGFKST